MTALELMRFLTGVPFVVIFVVVFAVALRQRRRINFDVALFFGAAATILVASWIRLAIGADDDEPAPAWYTIPLVTLLISLPYLQLRLVHDLAGVRRVVMLATELGLVLCVAVLAASDPYPVLVLESVVAYFVAVEAYVVYRVVREARLSRGVTRRRLWSVAVGNGLLGLVLLVTGIEAAIPAIENAATVVSQVLVLAAGLAFAVGYTPPTWLRVAWQSPAFRRFVRESGIMTHEHDLPTVARFLEERVAETTGAPAASVLLWDEEQQRLVAPSYQEIEFESPLTFAEAVYHSRVPAFTDDVTRTDPRNAEVYRTLGARAVLAAPLELQARRLGVLAVFAERPSLFAADDLEFLSVLAGQVALILNARELLEEAAVVRAQAEATRLKDDFLSAAAHDLKTPLTTLIGRAQLMERRSKRNPERPLDPDDVRHLVQEGQRMRLLVSGLLDASRADHSGFVTDLRLVDVGTLVEEAVAGFHSTLHHIEVDAEPGTTAVVDAERIRQVMQNLVDNAIKYSPQGGRIAITVRHGDASVRINVCDEGIGISKDDLPLIFGRFHRGSVADDRRFAGMGIGLYLCQQIVQEHGGRIWAESEEGRGTCIHLWLPAGGIEERES